jgi:transposase
VRESELFALGLGIVTPWNVVDLDFREGEVHVSVDFEKGARFGGLPVHDTVERTWRHLNFFKYPCFVHARVPRLKDKDGSVRMVDVPWGRPGSGFTLDFESHALSLMRQMPVLAAARELGVHDTRLWRLLRFYVNWAFQSQEIGSPVRIGVDETAARRGHDYITVFVDLDARRVLFACEGRSGVALALLRQFLESKGVEPDSVKEFACDMSPAFLSGIEAAFPNAKVTLDKFHLVAMLTKAVDETRKTEAKKYKALQGTRWIWLKNPNNLSSAQHEALKGFFLENDFCLTAQAYSLKLQFQELFLLKKPAAERFFNLWLDRALESGLRHIEGVATTFFKRKEMILNWFDSKISNGILEGFHSVLQATKNKARGYRDPRNLIAMSYLLHGKLEALTHCK